MRVLIAPDKFKGSLSALGVAEAMAEGVRLADPGVEVTLFPLADGGEGTAEILTFHTGGQLVEAEVRDPLFRPINASFGLSGDGRRAFIEMATASGLPLLRPEERNCFHTTTLGTGELVLAAIRQGARHIILGIGGSATNDAGIGMASALGYRFLDGAGEPLAPVGRNLGHIRRIDASQLLFDPGEVTVHVACDVDNPLHGPQGASWVYGPQKGASPAELEELDRGLAHFAGLVEDTFGQAVAEVPGAGAAGGLGAGALLFLRAALTPGIDLVMAQTRLAEQLAGIDLILTGEGKLDRQTLSGKVVKGVCDLARPRGIPVAALCGTLEATPEETRALGLAFAGSVLRGPCSLEEALAQAPESVRVAAEQVVRLFRAGGK
jgi:glycerate 2-kinase